MITIGIENVVSFYFILPFCNKPQSRTTPNIQSFQFSALVYFKNISLAQLYLHPKTLTSLFFIITFSAILYMAQRVLSV